jgi:hypothetical protein
VSDWELFTREVSWFVPPGVTPEVGAEHPWRRGSVAELPELSRLLGAANVTPVSIGDEPYELLAWGPPNSRRGWLSAPPTKSLPKGVHRTHQAFWTVCGGIVERFSEPLTWWTNHNEVLTPAAVHMPLAPVLHDYEWLWEQEHLTIPIQPSDFYVVAIEANGNMTLAHRATGELLLFAPDHSFNNVAPLPGCPPYSLLTIDDIPDLGAWIEACARAWQTL